MDNVKTEQAPAAYEDFKASMQALVEKHPDISVVANISDTEFVSRYVHTKDAVEALNIITNGLHVVVRELADSRNAALVNMVLTMVNMTDLDETSDYRDLMVALSEFFKTNEIAQKITAVEEEEEL